jgi:hypothetical protein
MLVTPAQAHDAGHGHDEAIVDRGAGDGGRELDIIRRVWRSAHGLDSGWRLCLSAGIRLCETRSSIAQMFLFGYIEFQRILVREGKGCSEPGRGQTRGGNGARDTNVTTQQPARRKALLLDGYSQEMPMSTRTQERVYDLLHRMPQAGLAAAKQLFWTELNYDRANDLLPRRGWPDRAQSALESDPLLLAQHRSQFGSFDVISARLTSDAGFDSTYKVATVSRDDLCLHGLLNPQALDLMMLPILESRGGYLECTPMCIGQLSHPESTSAKHAAIENVVRKPLCAHQMPGVTGAPDTSMWERSSRELVYQVYGLTEEEIAIVEGQR